MLVCKRLYNTREQAAHDELGDISAILLLSSSLKSHNCLISCIAAQRFSCFIVQLDMFQYHDDCGVHGVIRFGVLSFKISLFAPFPNLWANYKSLFVRALDFE